MKGVSVGIYKAYQKPKKETKSKISVSSYLSKSKNNGGLLGGLGYVGGSIAAGVGGIGEGILDLGAAGIALLGGDKEYAKYVFKDNVVGDWHQSLTESYNPTGVMQFIGDVGQGLGQSATMLIPYVGVPAFFLGVGSQGISGAAEKTGDVGFKEVAYGATTGAIEGTLEWALGAAGQGAKSIASAIAKRGGKGAAKTLFSTAVRRGLAGKILSSAAGEFLEEAASEVVDVGLQRLYRIDPNASTSLKDVLYAGIVGAVSGGIMGGSVNVVQTLNNRATGRKVIQDGNAQTLVNTANLVADKLAGQGTNFRRAPEWVKTLRGEIDAYNKLVEKGEQNSAKVETILGEMQASLFFAETQAIASGLAYSIQQSSDENRATLAEYVNQTIPKNKRTREYTAEDIAKDTDGITMQLAILQFAGNEFINYADAISSLEADQEQEGAIGDVVGAMQQESAETVEAGQGEAAASAETVTVNQESSAGGVANQANAGIFDASAGVSTEGEVAKSDLASPLTDAKYSVATAKRAQKRIKENAARAERARQARINADGRVVEGASQEQSTDGKFAVQKSAEKADKAVEGKTEEKSGERKNEADKPVIKQPKEALTDAQRAERAKERAKKLREYEATVKVTSKELNTAREYVKDFDSLPKGARQAVIKMIRSADGKVEKKILAGVANLMTMRRRNGELVMPDLELRFAEGIVDGGLYTHIGEGESRRVLILINSDAGFKETIRGTIAHEIVHYIENRAGYKALAAYVLKTAKKEKIAEIEKEYNEHYEGIYTVEAEKAGLTGEAITKKVAERMATEEHRELIKSEVVAKLIGLRLNNEKFLQKYATKDEAMIKKIFRFLRASVSYLKDKDKATADEVTRLVNVFSAVIGSSVASEEKTGETEFIKYSAMNKESLASNVDKILQMSSEDAIANKEAGNFVSVMKNTPTIIIENVEGAENLEIVMRFDSFYLATRHEGALEGHYHNYGEIMKRLPEIIADPQAIIRMDSGRINIYSQIQTKKGNNSIVSIELNTVKDINSKYDKYNLLVSVMPAKDNYARNNLVNHGVKVEYEKEDLPQVNHQLHEWLAIVNERSSKDSIPQKSDLSTGLEKKVDGKRDLAPRKNKPVKTKAEQEANRGNDVYFERAVAEGYKKEAEEAKRSNEAYKEGNKILNEKLEKTRQEKKVGKEKNESLRRENKSLARQIAQDAYETDAKTFTQKEIDALIGRIGEYSTDKFKDIMDEKKATISKIDKEQFAYDIYIAFHVASADKRVMDRISVLADKLARQYIDGVYYADEKGKRIYLADVVDEAAYKQYVNTFRRKIIASFKEMGRETTHARITAKYKAEMAKLQARLLDSENRGKNLRELQWQAKRLRQTVDVQKRSPQDEGVYEVEKELSRIADERGRVSSKQADKAFDKLYLFLTTTDKGETALKDFVSVEGESLIGLLEDYKKLREKHKGTYLNTREMALTAKIIAGSHKLLKEYNRVYYNGHWEDMGKLATDEVKDLIGFSGASKDYKNKVTKWLSEKADKYLQGAYFYNILAPETVIETLEGFKQNGVLKTLFHNVRAATQKAEHLAVQMKKPFAEFLDSKDNVWTDDNGKKHSFRDKLNKKIVNVNGNEITLGEAIYLFMLMKREHSHLGLTESGFITYDENNQIKLQFKILDIEAAKSMIYGQLDGTDKSFLDMAEKFFNETASKIKYDADIKILGYTNNQDGYYVPIIRDRYSRLLNVTDKRQSVGSIATVYNPSFTQNTVENTKALEGKNIMAIINDHADGLADYSELYLPLKSFDRVYNTKVITDTAQVTSIRKVLNNDVWSGADDYFKNLFQDIQGQRVSTEVLDKVVGKLRSGWVNSVLGLNLKVVATQTTSYVAANQVIEMKYLAPALSKFVGNIDDIRQRAYKYSDIIEARSFDMASLKAQGNIDKVNELGKKSGFLIEKMDERVCLAIFHAGELKAEALGYGAVGTESNSIAAAKIADEAIYTTQAMTSKAERSALQRSKSEVARTLSMFTSDSVKQLSHMYGNVMQYIAHKQRAKTDPSYEALLKEDAKKVGRSATTLVMTGIMLGLITQAFKYLYAKEEEEPEDKAKDFAIDIVSSTLNILPIVSDVMDKFVHGYDISLNVFDIANDTIEDTSKLFNMAGKAMSGEYVSNAEVGKNVINAVKTYGTVLGVPIAPVERTVSGLLRRFAPSTVYGYDAMFKNSSYTADLKKAVESGDERLAEHILTQLYKSELSGVYTSEELEIVADLYSKGYTSVIPQRVGETINDVKLDRKQRQQFNKIYAQASSKVMEMIATAEFKALSEEQQAKAIKNLYSLYYNRAASTVAGKEVSNAQMYSWLTDNYSALFTAQAYKGGLDVVKNDKGKEVSVRDQFVEYAQNLGLSESDLLVVEFANGVRDKKTRAALIEHINTLTLSDEQKAVIAEKLSLEVKDGKLVEKKE